MTAFKLYYRKSQKRNLTHSIRNTYTERIFGRQKVPKERCDLPTIIRAFSKYFVVFERLVVKNSLSTYVWSKLDSFFATFCSSHNVSRDQKSSRGKKSRTAFKGKFEISVFFSSLLSTEKNAGIEPIILQKEVILTKSVYF